MYKGKITTPTPVTNGVNIPFVLDMNTNTNTEYDNTDNTVDIRNVGFYNITSDLVVTGVAVGGISAQLYADGVAIPEAVASATSGAVTDLITLSIKDVERVIANNLRTFTNLSVRLSADATISSGTFIIEKVR